MGRPQEATLPIVFFLLVLLPPPPMAGATTTPTPLCSQAMLAAARYGDVAQLELSLQVEVPQCVDDQGKTPLHFAAEFNQMEAALKLLAAGALMDRDQLGRSPLHEAAAAGNVNMTKLLLDAGAYVELSDWGERRPLHLAAREGREELVRTLLDRSAVIDAVDSDQRTALHFASRGDENINVTKLLFERGASIESSDVVGFRPLHFACFESQLETAAFLVGKGADLYAMDTVGWNPLVHAAAKGHEGLVDFLITTNLQPKTYPPPDPAMFLEQDIQAVGFLGLPAWMFMLIVIIVLGLGVVCPGMYMLRRMKKLSRPFVVTATDESIGDFLDEVFEGMAHAKEEQIKRLQEWDNVPAHTLTDLHRVKGNL